MGFKRYKMLQKYINGEATDEYKQGELIDDTVYSTLDDCNDGNQNPDKPIEGDIYQWVTVTGEYICYDGDKYTKQKEQRSSDGGVTWTDTGRIKKGDLIEIGSVVCEYNTKYLTFEALEDGTFTFTGTDSNSLSYTLDGGNTWTALASGVASPTVTTGNKIMWKGNCVANTSENGRFGIGKFSSSGNFKVYGNIMSLLYGDDYINSTVISIRQFGFLFESSKVVNAENLILPSMTLRIWCYYSMFANCTSLTTAPTLPATTLADWCYAFIFNGCSSLTTAPVLPATTMAEGCYCRMFEGCTSLTTAPVLPATTLADSCYNSMFQGCTSLTTAPELPATTLAQYCYGNMFDGCRNLTTAPALPVTNLSGAVHCYASMFQNCRSLTTAPALPATTLAFGCYNGMFEGCTSLVNAPALPATTLAQACYYWMFGNCNQLVNAPELPATTLANTCYYSMFYNCTSLVTAPELPATELASGCYYNMFEGCTSLNSITCLATNISATDCTKNWVSSVAANGTFTKALNMYNWTTGTNGIPSGWNVING